MAEEIQEIIYQENKDGNKIGLSIAVIITVLGLLLLCAGTAMGCVLIGWSIAVSLLSGFAVALFVGAAVFIGAIAKSESGQFKKWARVKLICIVVMVVALICGMYPTMVTFNFFADVKELRGKATVDKEALQRQMNEFFEHEKNRVNTTFDGLKNAANIGNPKLSQELIEFLNAEALYYANGGTIYAPDIDTRRNVYLDRVENIELDGTSLRSNKFEAEFDRIQKMLVDIYPWTFASLEKSIDKAANEQNDILSTFSEELKMPEVKCGQGSDTYTVFETEGRSYNQRPTSYAEAYKSITSITVTGAVSALLVALISILHFLLTAPSLRQTVNMGDKASDKYGLTI